MKSSILSVVWLAVLSCSALAQKGILDDAQAPPDSIPAQFGSRAQVFADRKNIADLQEFLSERQELLEEQTDLQIAITNRIRSLDSILIYSETARDLQSAERYIVNGAKLIRIDDPRDKSFFEYLLKDTLSGKFLPVERLKPVVEGLRSELKKVEASEHAAHAALARVKLNIRNLRFDIDRAQSAFTQNISVDIAQQSFKSQMSLIYACLVGFLIMTVFATIIFSRNRELVQTLMSEFGLQFVTLFVLIIAIILFGILGILEGKELAAILAGISGYILGRGATVAKDRAAERRADTGDGAEGGGDQ